MRTLILGSCVLLFACAAVAQEAPEYGPVNIVAASSTERGLDVANQLAKETATVLSDERTVKVNDVESFPVGPVTDADLVRIAGSNINWVAVVNFDATSADHGVFEVEVAHVEFNKVVSRVSAWIGKAAYGRRKHGRRAFARGESHGPRDSHLRLAA
jgi:hypothetical protein